MNVVVFSEGYTTNQLAQFLADATNAVHALLANPPYCEYRAYFNAYSISVASKETGSDHPAWPQYRDTYFDSRYDGYLITIPAGTQGQGKVDALLQALMPECDLPILLVNDTFYGGSANPGGSGGRLLIASIHGDSPELLAHESGHTLAGLGDEYEDPYPGYPDTEEPNTTRETRREFVKWKAWIAPTTPLPTPPTYEYVETVGLFEGAHYQPTDWYRPKLNCKMRTLYSPFCEVCSEALVLSLYRKVRPVDDFLPAGTTLSVTSTQAVLFSLTPLQPATHNLDVQWFTNGMPVIGAVGFTLTLLPQWLDNGTHTVRADVKDNTPLARIDPTNRLTQSVSWLVNVNALPELRLGAPSWLSQGGVYFQVTGRAPNGFVLQGSADLRNWVSLSTNFLSDGQFSYTNYDTTNFTRHFFRALARP